MVTVYGKHKRTARACLQSTNKHSYDSTTLVSVETPTQEMSTFYCFTCVLLFEAHTHLQENLGEESEEDDDEEETSEESEESHEEESGGEGEPAAEKSAPNMLHQMKASPNMLHQIPKYKRSPLKTASGFKSRHA
jgi:hypothetical protein